MSLACEVEVRAVNECALRFSLTSKPAPVLEYIKAISSFVGASHILAVFEENESLKVFFDHKTYADSIIGSCIHVMGRHVLIDYVVPPGVKVVLSDVDPVISNHDISIQLSTYGDLVSPVIRPPISDDTELCHIGYGVRYVYMVLNGCLPNRFELVIANQNYTIKVKIDDRSGLVMIPYIKTDHVDELIETNANPEALPCPATSSLCPALECVGSAASDANSSAHIKSSKSFQNISPSKGKVGRPRKYGVMKHKVINSSQTARHLKSKRKFLSARLHNYYNRGRTGYKSTVKRAKSVMSLPLTPLSSDNAELLANVQENGEESIYKASYSGKCVLDMQKLEMFIDEVKHHRAPLELAKKYIGDNWNDDAFDIFIEQLNVYKSNQADTCLKARVWRLVKTLKEAMEAEDV